MSLSSDREASPLDPLSFASRQFSPHAFLLPTKNLGGSSFEDCMPPSLPLSPQGTPINFGTITRECTPLHPNFLDAKNCAQPFGASCLGLSSSSSLKAMIASLKRDNLLTDSGGPLSNLVDCQSHEKFDEHTKWNPPFSISNGGPPTRECTPIHPHFIQPSSESFTNLLQYSQPYSSIGLGLPPPPSLMEEHAASSAGHGAAIPDLKKLTSPTNSSTDSLPLVDQIEKPEDQIAKPRIVELAAHILDNADDSVYRERASYQPATLQNETMPAPSLGSVGHPHTCALGCKYNSRAKGCKDGPTCKWCHLCHWRRRGKANQV